MEDNNNIIEDIKSSNNNNNERKVLRIYQQNCYLIPGILTYNPLFVTCIRQDERAALISQMAAQHDISCFQEVWGSQNHILYKYLHETHDMTEQKPNEKKMFNWVRTMKDSVRMWWEQDGGLYHAWKKDLKLINTSKILYTKSVPLANQGVKMLRYNISNYYPDKSELIVFNTHLDIQSHARRRSNLREFRSFLIKEIIKMYQSGEEETEEEEKNNNENDNQHNNSTSVDWSKIAILIVGDFNIDAKPETKMYDEMYKIGNIRDLFTHNPDYETTDYQYTLHPRIKDSKTGNSMFPWPIDPKRVDYILALDSIQLRDEEYEEFSIQPGDFPIEIKFARIECHSFKIIKQEYGEEYSDHYGNSATIEII